MSIPPTFDWKCAARTFHRAYNGAADKPQVAPLSRPLRGRLNYLLECLRLRVKDIDFGQHLIVVRDTNGNEDRVTLLPEQLEPILQEHLTHVKHSINLILRRALARSICPMR